MLMSEYMHTIDAKGRVILPSDFRSELGETFVITKGLDGCLFIYGQTEWDALSGKLRQMSLAKPEARAVARFFFSGARTLDCDKQGRFLVPPSLRAHAKLKKDVVLIGVCDRVELWDRGTWEKYNNEISPAVTEIASQLTDLGI